MVDLRAFEQPQKLVTRAKFAWSETDKILQAFFVPKNLHIVVEKELATGDFVKKIKMVNPLPDAVEGNLTDALNNVRNSFDQSIFAACLSIDKPIKDGHYPWACDPTDLGRRLKHVKTGKELVPNELWECIRSQQPYPTGGSYQGGDTGIRALAKLANSKHTVGINVGCTVGAVQIPSFTASQGEISVRIPRWDSVKNEVEVLRWRGTNPKFGREPSSTFYIVFDALTPGILRGQDAMYGLKIFANFAQRIIEEFRAVAAAHGG